MFTETKRNVGTIVLRAAKGYVIYLFSVPAILLHAFGIMMALIAVYALFVSKNIAGTQDILVWILGRFGVESISYHGNPTGAILRLYFFLALAFEIVGWILKPFLPKRPFGFWKKFAVLTALSAACYALVVASVAASQGIAAALPMFIPFAITAFFTFLALGVSHALNHLRVSATKPSSSR